MQDLTDASPFGSPTSSHLVIRLARNTLAIRGLGGPPFWPVDSP